MAGVPWPGHQVLLKITDPSHCQMYRDILESGGRRILVPFSKARRDGRVRMGEFEAKDQRLHAYGAVLYLSGLEDVSEQTGGTYKYVAEHVVRGRARINRLLNPSILFQSDDEAAFETEYLRAEVDLFEDQDVEVSCKDGLSDLAAWQEIEKAWIEINELSAGFDEPRLESASAIREAGVSSWRAAALWEMLQRKLKMHRENSKIYGEAQAWIKQQQRAGAIPATLPKQLNACKLGMPPLLIEKLRVAEAKGQANDLGEEFWQPFLSILAAGDVEQRARVLRQLVYEEAQATRTHAMLSRLIGAGLDGSSLTF
jgi:hypothetical protein